MQDLRRHSYASGTDARSMGIEVVTRMVPNSVALGSAGPAMVAVSLPRIRFLEDRPIAATVPRRGVAGGQKGGLHHHVLPSDLPAGIAPGEGRRTA